MPDKSAVFSNDWHHFISSS